MVQRPSDTLMGKIDFDHRPADDCGGAMIGGKGENILLGGDCDDSLFGNEGNGGPFADNGNDQPRGYDLNALLFGGYGDDLPIGGGPRDRLDDCDWRDTPLCDADGGFSFGDDDNGTLGGVGGSGLQFVGNVGDRLRGGDGADAFIFAAVHNGVGLEADGKIRLSARTSRDSTTFSPSIVSMRSEAMSFPRSTTNRPRGLRTRPSTSTAKECSSSSMDLELRSRLVFLHSSCRNGSVASIRRSRPRNGLLPRPGFRKFPIWDRKFSIKFPSAHVPSIPVGQFAQIRRISEMPPLSRAPSIRSNMEKTIMAELETTLAYAQKTGREPILRPGSDEEGRRTGTFPAEAKSTPRHGTLSDEPGRAGKPTTRRT